MVSNPQPHSYSHLLHVGSSRRQYRKMTILYRLLIDSVNYRCDTHSYFSLVSIIQRTGRNFRVPIWTSKQRYLLLQFFLYVMILLCKYKNIDLVEEWWGQSDPLSFALI